MKLLMRRSWFSPLYFLCKFKPLWAEATISHNLSHTQRHLPFWVHTSSCVLTFLIKKLDMFVTACTTVQLNDISDFFGWNCFSFKSAWIFACAFQFSSKTFSCIFSLKCSCFAFLRSLCTLRYFVLVSLGNKVQTSQKNTGECFTT